MTAVPIEPAIITDPAAVTPAWLTAVLRAAGHDATVQACTSEPVGTGQMARSERFHLQYDEATNAPRSVVGKFPSPSEASRAGGAAGGYRNEVRFYTDLVGSVAVRTPRCLHAAITDDGSEFVLILEDLAPARQGDQIAGCTVPQLLVAAENLAALHAPRWCDPTLRDLDWIASSSDQGAGYATLVAPMFLERYAAELTLSTAEVFETFGAHADRWVAGAPADFTVLHGDYRLDNLLFAPDGVDASECSPVAAVDWQTVSVAHGGRDLAYLLGTSVEPAVRREVEADVRAAYLARLHELGAANVDAATVKHGQRHGSFQAPFITMLGAISAGRTERGDRMFIAMAERGAAQVRDLDALDLLI